MSNGYVATENVLGGVSQVLGASVTKQAVSKQKTINNSSAATNLRVELDVSSVTVGAGIDAILQHSCFDDPTKFSDVKTVAITADGTSEILFNVEVAADQPFAPLKPRVRVVVTTGAGSAVTVTSVRIVGAE